MHLLFVFERYQKFLMHLEKICIRNFWYISKFYDTYQNFMIHIRNFWYISEISDTYQLFLIHIRNFWYISKFYDTYQNFMIHIRFFWYISEISDTYQIFLIHIRNFWYIFFLMIHIKILWYISEISDTYVFGCQNLIGIRISDTHQSWGHNMCKKVSNWVVLEAVFKLFYTYCAHSSCLH